MADHGRKDEGGRKNGADGMSDIEGKATRVGASERGQRTSFNYFPDTDSLYIDLSHKQSTESQEVSEGVVLDYDAEGNLVGIDMRNLSIENVKKRGDLPR